MRFTAAFVCLLGCTITPSLALAFKTSSNVKNQPVTRTTTTDKQPRFHRRALATIRRGSVVSTLDVPEENGLDEVKSVGIASATFSLVKAMVGSGVLTLPAGLAAVSNYPNALYPASALLIVLGALSAYTFSLYGRLTDQTQAKSLGDLWKKIMKTDQSILVSACSFIYCFGTLVAFGLILGDSLSSLAVAGGFTGLMASRQASILAVTGAVLYPLCNLSSLAALAPVSILGVLGSITATLFLGFRCPAIVKSSPYATAAAAAASPLLRSIPAAMQPSFNTYQKGMSSPAPLILIAMASTSLMCHFSAPDFYHSLADPSAANNNNKDDSKPSPTLQKFTKMTLAAFFAVTIINVLTITFGFLTFGGNSDGIILNNYSPKDFGASISRILVTISVIGGYPFLMSACRSEALELFAKGKDVTQGLKRKATAILITILTGLCLVLKDAGFVISFNGSLMGSALIFTFPAFLFLKLTSTGAVDRSQRLERMFCRFLVGFGCVTGLMGAATSVLNSYFPHLLV
jgi:sodium-coupled neutral amino acid transporter 11